MTPKQIDADAIETEKDGSKCAPIKNDPPEKKNMDLLNHNLYRCPFPFSRGKTFSSNRIQPLQLHGMHNSLV